MSYYVMLPYLMIGQTLMDDDERACWNSPFYPSSYPITEDTLDIGIYGCPFILKHDDNKSKPQRKRYYKDTTLLDPYDHWIHVDRHKPKPVGNEIQLGREVVELINEELSSERKRPIQWRNQLGVIKMEDTDIVIRPHFDPKGIRQGINFEECIALEGSEGLTIQSSSRLYPLNHPPQQIFTDYESGFALVLEDYKGHLFYGDPDSGRILTMGTNEMACKYGCVNRWGNVAVTIEGGLLLLDSGMGVKSNFEIENSNQVCFGGNNMIFCSGGREMYFIDWRGNYQQSIDCGEEIEGICNPLEYTLPITTRSKLSLFDIRQFKRPLIEYDSRYLGYKKTSKLTWIKDTLLLYNHSEMPKLSFFDDLNGRINVESVTLRAEGLDVSGELVVWLDGEINAMKREELVNREIPKIPVNEETKEPKSLPSKDKFISAIYNMEAKGDANVEDQFKPLPYSKAAQILEKQWKT